MLDVVKGQELDVNGQLIPQPATSSYAENNTSGGAGVEGQVNLARKMEMELQVRDQHKDLLEFQITSSSPHSPLPNPCSPLPTSRNRRHLTPYILIYPVRTRSWASPARA